MGRRGYQGRAVLATRLARLIARLQQERIRSTVPQLARDYDVSERTIKRDLRALEAAGIPLPPAMRPWRDDEEAA